jgi:catechol 2,3-dioxygenase-like lactoylglutathione lyase family enzyme
MTAAAEVIGIDHIYLTVTSVQRSEPFYDRLLRDALGFRKSVFTLAGDGHVQYYNRHFGIVLRPAHDGGPTTGAHDRYRPGLHHLCLRVPGIDDVNRVVAALGANSIAATVPRLYAEYAPDYYATFVDDPDGLRLEITNFRAERQERMQRWPDGG